MADTPKPMQGTWTLAAPDGRTWSGESPSRCVAAESRERVPAEVALQRIFDAASEDHDWKPIETAPKDGTRVILSWSGKSISGFYLDNSRTATPWAGWRVESMVAQPAGTPTHWQAFPPPYGLTGAQPAPAAPSEPMPSIPNDPECTCGSTSPRAYHHAGSCPHSTPWNDRVKARLAAAPAAQPADSAMEVLQRIIAATHSHIDGRDLLAELHPRNTLDIKRRVDARETWFEADWLSDLWREIKAARALIAKETPHAR